MDDGDCKIEYGMGIGLRLRLSEVKVKVEVEVEVKVEGSSGLRISIATKVLWVLYSS